MNRITSNSSRLLAGALAVLLTSGAAFADVAGYKQLSDSVGNQLTALQVSTDGLGLLTVGQLSQLTSVLDQPGKDEDKAMAAEYLLQSFLHPSTVTLDSAEGKQLVSDLTAKLTEIGEPFPTQPLTTTQLQALLNAINNHKKIVNQKSSIEAVLAQASRSSDVTTSNEGVVQLEAGIDAKLTGLGITPPPAGTVTFDQLGKLDAILSSTTASDADKKSQASQVLGLN